MEVGARPTAMHGSGPEAPVREAPDAARPATGAIAAGAVQGAPVLEGLRRAVDGGVTAPAFDDLAPEIVDDIGSRLVPVDLAALAGVNHESQLTLEPRMRAAGLAHRLARTTRLEPMRAWLQEAQGLPDFLKGEPLLAAARCLDRLDANEREDAFRDLLRASLPSRDKAAILIELSIQLTALPRGTQTAVTCDLLAAAASAACFDRVEVVAGIFSCAQPAYRGSTLSWPLFKESRLFFAAAHAISRLPSHYRAPPLNELAYLMPLHGEHVNAAQYQRLLDLLDLIPEADLPGPLLELCREFHWLEIDTQGLAFDRLCHTSTRLATQDRAEFLLSTLPLFNAMAQPARTGHLRHLVRLAQAVREDKQSLLLAQIATRVKMVPAGDRPALFHDIVEASAGLSRMERRGPLAVVLYQGRILEVGEAAILRARCRALWEDDGDLAPVAGESRERIMDQIERASESGCPSWLAGLIVQALDTSNVWEASTGFAWMLEAIQWLPSAMRATLIARLARQLQRLSADERLTMFERLLGALAEIPERHCPSVLEGMLWEVCAFRPDSRAAPWHRLLAATRHLTRPCRSSLLSSLHYLVGMLPVPERPRALGELIRTVALCPVEQRPVILAQLATSATHLPGPEQAIAFGQILDATESMPLRQAILALVRYHSRRLDAAARHVLLVRCDALSPTRH